jgi:hypothetical protein
MFEAIDMSLVDWSRAQFALTALIIGFLFHLLCELFL